jgi:hypothetical protein
MNLKIKYVIFIVGVILFLFYSCGKEEVISPKPPKLVLNYSKGAFWIVKNNIYFKPYDGETQKNIYSKNNEGKVIPNSEVIAEVISHDEGSLIMTNPSNQQGNSKVYFMDLDFKLLKQIEIRYANLNPNRYAIVNKKLYYTNVGSRISFAAPEYKSYIIDLVNHTAKEFNLKMMQYASDSEGNIYCMDVANSFYKLNDVDDLNNLTKLNEFDQWLNSFVIDENNIVWGVYRDLTGANPLLLAMERVYKPINILRYDISKNLKVDTKTTKEFNVISGIGLSKDKSNVYIITLNDNENKKTLFKLNHEKSASSLMKIMNISSSPYLNYRDYTIGGIDDKKLWIHTQHRINSRNFMCKINLKNLSIENLTSDSLNIQKIFF